MTCKRRKNPIGFCPATKHFRLASMLTGYQNLYFEQNIHMIRESAKSMNVLFCTNELFVIRPVTSHTFV